MSPGSQPGQGPLLGWQLGLTGSQGGGSDPPSAQTLDKAS